MDSRVLVPLTEAAKLLGISRVTLSQLAKAGRFTVYENPADRRQRLVDLDEVKRELAPRPILKPDGAPRHGQDGSGSNV
jgi:excisionase family DNA binding protein